MQKPCALAFLLVLMAGLLNACLTPMGPADIDALTTCPNTDLALARRNLLLNGYGIASSSDEDLVTDFKEVASRGSGRTLQRITVLKTERQTLKFRVRIRVEDVQPYPSSSVATSVTIGNERHMMESQRFYSVFPLVHELDQGYYVQHRADYAATRREICGATAEDPLPDSPVPKA